MATATEESGMPAWMSWSTGKDFDRSFLDELRTGVDPCGERGEFHTFAFDGPGFREPVAIVNGAVVERDGFVFADLRPAATQPRP